MLIRNPGEGQLHVHAKSLRSCPGPQGLRTLRACSRTTWAVCALPLPGNCEFPLEIVTFQPEISCLAGILCLHAFPQIIVFPDPGCPTFHRIMRLLDVLYFLLTCPHIDRQRSSEAPSLHASHISALAGSRSRCRTVARGALSTPFGAHCGCRCLPWPGRRPHLEVCATLEDCLSCPGRCVLDALPGQRNSLGHHARCLACRVVGWRGGCRLAERPLPRPAAAAAANRQANLHRLRLACPAGAAFAVPCPAPGKACWTPGPTSAGTASC